MHNSSKLLYNSSIRNRMDNNFLTMDEFFDFLLTVGRGLFKIKFGVLLGMPLFICSHIASTRALISSRMKEHISHLVSNKSQI